MSQYGNNIINGTVLIATITLPTQASPSKSHSKLILICFPFEETGTVKDTVYRAIASTRLDKHNTRAGGVPWACGREPARHARPAAVSTSSTASKTPPGILMNCQRHDLLFIVGKYIICHHWWALQTSAEWVSYATTRYKELSMYLVLVHYVKPSASLKKKNRQSYSQTHKHSHTRTWIFQKNKKLWSTRGR